MTDRVGTGLECFRIMMLIPVIGRQPAAGLL